MSSIKAAKGRAKQEVVQPEDLLRFRLVGSPQISPDGSRIVFVEKHVGEKNEYVTNLFLTDTATGETRQFTHAGKDSAPRWSPDGRSIALIRATEKHHPQIYLIDVDGGEARQLSSFPEGSLGKFMWSPDGKYLAVAYREQSEKWTEEAKQDREQQGLSTPPRVVDDLWHRMDGDGYFDAQRYQLYLLDAETGEHKLVYSKDTLGMFDFDFSPKSDELVVATNRDKKALFRPWKDELLRVNVVTGKTTPIRGLPKGPKSCVRYSPDGKLIAFAGREDTTDGIYSTENLELWVCDTAGGNARSLTGGEDVCLLAVAISDTSEAVFEPELEFSPDGSRVFFKLGHHGQMMVAAVPVEGGKVTRFSSDWPEVVPGNISSDGKRMALLVGSPTQLAEVAVGNASTRSLRVKQLTHLNDELNDQLNLREPECHWVAAADGTKVQVWSILPSKARRDSEHPAILEVHGGPHAQYGCGFFHEFQVLAAAGYAVFFSNPRGSKGYGRDHCAAIRGNWGTADWMDIQAVTEFIKSQPNIDASRVGIMGGSYGGYMTNWAISHCDDFKAAISDRCVSNLVSMSGNTDFPIQEDRYFPGNFWDRPEQRWQQSPIAYFGNVKTPTLFIHSEGDLRCNVEQSEQVFTALKLRGVPSRFVRYPSSTSHGMSRQGPPDLRIHRLNEILRWWEEYLRG